MAKFHINPDTGKAGTCTASARPCKFGDSTPHYSSTADAQAAFEKTMSDSTLSTHSRSGDTMTLERPKVALERLAEVQSTVDKVYAFSGSLARSAGRASEARKAEFKSISKAIDDVVIESDLTTVDGSEKALDRLEELKNELNRKGDDFDASGQSASASIYWEASEGLADLIVDNGPEGH